MAPVAIGLTVGMALTFAHATVRRGRRHAWADWAVVALAGLAGTAFPSSSVAIILAGLLGGALLLGHERPHGDPDAGAALQAVELRKKSPQALIFCYLFWYHARQGSATSA